MTHLEEIIQQYLNTIVFLADRKLPITQATLHYLEQRAYGAYGHEIGDQKVSLIVDENKELTFTIY